METKEFKAESKRLLDLMINSIYTHKEIFLRELISNASDAIDKLYYKSLTGDISGLSRDSFSIDISLNKEERTLTISDNGVGMTYEELENNLGTIAKSGSLDFKNQSGQEEKAAADIDIIGQFGVGFYSAFMVSDSIEVLSKAYGGGGAYLWKSSGADGYTIETAEKDGNGTTITLHLRENDENEEYDSYLDQYKIRGLIKKYSDYIRYPIRMDITSTRMKETKSEDDIADYEEYTENTVINSMVPLWKKNKSEITEEQYNEFYSQNFYDYSKPQRVIHTYTEGAANYSSLLFIPAKAPANYYTKEYEKGLKLYASGVLITDCCKDLLPDHFGFVKGLVDSQDLSLNISREMLQHNKQLSIISSRLEKKIKSELLSMLTNEREQYEQFFDAFGLQLKYGIYSDYGQHSEVLRDLLLFKSSFEGKYTSLSEYVSRMKEEQKAIYYACGESAEKIAKLPQIEILLDKGYEVLYLTDDVDEFAVKILRVYDEKEFCSASSANLDVENEEEKADAEKIEADNKDMFEYIASGLSEKVSAVRPSKRLRSHPVCLSAEGEISLEMEKVLNSMPSGQKISAQRVLEINANHPVFSSLTKLYAEDKEKLAKYAELLYNQALLIEGLPVDDPVAFSNLICELM
ncbi:MAG: molecular chaperone HtpG [Oscillospiraceae bacterium]|jgi:molecular chaperone HtpG|nr:molecular chaperone HtpG [Oscillospiraceae bacterium]